MVSTLKVWLITSPVNCTGTVVSMGTLRLIMNSRYRPGRTSAWMGSISSISTGWSADWQVGLNGNVVVDDDGMREGLALQPFEDGNRLVDNQVMVCRQRMAWRSSTTFISRDRRTTPEEQVK